MVFISPTRTGRSFTPVNRSVAVYASGRIGNVVPDSNESLDTFLSPGPLYDDGICLAELRDGFEVVWLE